MLSFIEKKTGTVPSGAGYAFREFTQLYERRSKDDAPVSEESRRWWSRLLEHLAFEMMQAEQPTDFRLTISKPEAEDIFTKTRIFIGLRCEVRSPPAPLKKGGEEGDRTSCTCCPQ